jgi:hypothetical protein
LPLKGQPPARSSSACSACDERPAGTRSDRQSRSVEDAGILFRSGRTPAVWPRPADCCIRRALQRSRDSSRGPRTLAPSGLALAQAKEQSSPMAAGPTVALPDSPRSGRQPGSSRRSCFARDCERVGGRGRRCRLGRRPALLRRGADVNAIRLLVVRSASATQDGRVAGSDVVADSRRRAGTFGWLGGWLDRLPSVGFCHDRVDYELQPRRHHRPAAYSEASVPGGDECVRRDLSCGDVREHQVLLRA